MRLTVPSPAVIGVLLVPILLVSACSGEVSIGGVDQVTEAELVAETEDQVTGVERDTFEVTCDGGLDAEVGATQDCRVAGVQDAEASDESIGVRYVVTEVDGDEVSFSRTPFLDAESVALGVERHYSDQGITIDSVTCDDELIGEEGETTTCDITSSSDGDVTVEATSTGLDGLNVTFDLTVVS